VFHEMDANKDGKISWLEFKVIINAYISI